MARLFIQQAIMKPLLEVNKAHLTPAQIHIFKRKARAMVCRECHGEAYIETLSADLFNPYAGHSTSDSNWVVCDSEICGHLEPLLPNDDSDDYL